jgi:DNA excision repair protein ERCC-2
MRSPGTGGRRVEPEIIGSDSSDSESPDSTTDFGAGSKTVQLDEIDGEWTDYFPFDEPYADQVDGIEAYIDALTGNDNMVMEGACGTGKTLVGLTAGIHHLRNHDTIAEQTDGDVAEYSRVLAVTPVKQQLKQFIEEMATINEDLDDHAPLKTVVMRGQADVLPYAHVDYHPFKDYSVTAKIDDLRQMTIELIRFGSDVPLDWPEDMDPPEWSNYTYDWSEPSDEASDARDLYKFDPNRAACVVQQLNQRVAAGEDPLVVDGVAAPYPDGIPHTSDVVDEKRLQRSGTVQLPADQQGKFDPFYAGFFAHERMPFWFGDAPNSVMDSDALFRNGVEHGICPHQAMADMMEHADVLIGNYYHLFDPDTRLLTDMKTKVLDEETISILDEAHNIEETVRSILSDSHGINSFRHAVNDLRTALGYLNGDPGELPRSEMNDVSAEDVDFAKPEAEGVFENPAYSGITPDNFRDAMEFFNYLEGWLKERSEQHLEERFDNGWEYVVNNHRSWISTEDIPLEDPEEADPDELYDHIQEKYDDDIWQTAYTVSRAAQHIIDEVGVTDRVAECENVGEFFYRWATTSRTTFFREIVMEASYKDSPLSDTHRWTSEWTPKFQLYNCMPTQKLREVFSELGSALLMSATLEPIEEFNRTTGIGECVSPADIEDKEERAMVVRSGEADSEDDIGFRDVTVRRYPLRFPRKNRVSMTVDTEKYTYSNRGSPPTVSDNMEPSQDSYERLLSNMTATRQQYTKLLVDIASTRGNVLVCMPSYSEAEWAKSMIEIAGVGDSKDIVLDQSSSSEETDENLESFFTSNGAVIVTSSRGTITEGVDYDGDKLHTCVVVGVSLLPPKDRNKAVEHAYDENLDGISGFDATNKIPAVRKARQAIGRVIRGNDEIGARIFIDERYAKTGWGCVKGYLSEQEQEEFRTVRPENVRQRLDQFWQSSR